MIFQVPLCVIVAWIMGIKMDLNFNFLETGSLALSIIVTAFTLQVINLIIIIFN